MIGRPGPGGVPVQEYLGKVLSAEDLDGVIADLEGHIDRLQARWVLALFVSNSAAFATLSAKIVDVLIKEPTPFTKGFVALSIPSLWMFVVGLFCCGLSYLLNFIRRQKIVLGLRSARREIREGRIAGVATGPLKQEFTLILEGWVLEGLSAAMFFFGLTYPMIVLGLGYFRSGGFGW